MRTDLEATEREGMAQLECARSAEGLEAWRIAFLGSKGRLKALMPRLKDVPPAEKPEIGKLLNEVKDRLEAAFARRRETLASSAEAVPAFDVTEPGMPTGLGRRHVIMRTIEEILDVFASMGFGVAEGPEVEDEWHNFTALNIPPEHPARDVSDNFYMGAGRLLRTQTSTIQIRTMEKVKPPLKIVAVGRVYRPDAHDATHYSMFHQIEGLCVDRGVSMVDLKTVLLQFARAYFGPGAEVRIRPSFFPFTEPSAEVDMKMKLRGQYQWVELGGCGMVDPKVFESVGYDSEEWTGYAFGLGIERIAMRRYGIADIRWLYENDARFLRQF